MARDKHLKLDMNKVTDAQSESPFLIVQLFLIQPCQKILPKTTKWLKLAHQCSLIYLCEVNNDRFAVKTILRFIEWKLLNVHCLDVLYYTKINFSYAGIINGSVHMVLINIIEIQCH